MLHAAGVEKKKVRYAYTNFDPTKSFFLIWTWKFNLFFLFLHLQATRFLCGIKYLLLIIFVYLYGIHDQFTDIFAFHLFNL